MGPDNIPARLLKTAAWTDRKSTRLNSSHTVISYAVFCLKKKKKEKEEKKKEKEEKKKKEERQSLKKHTHS